MKIDNDYISGELKANRVFKRLKLEAMVRAMEKEANEELNMVIEDLQFRGLGRRALELLKEAPMNK